MTQIKTAVVTGGSRGIGRATVMALFEEGWNVVINYRSSQKEAEELAALLNCRKVRNRAVSVQADVSDLKQVEALFAQVDEQFGRVDVLVSNAGIARQELFTDVTEQQWREMVGVHLDGAFYCSQQALRRMISCHSGRIVYISSMWGQVGASCEVPYSAVKAALIGMTKGLAKEVGPSNITVNCICPGVIDTEMNRNLTEEILEELREETPLCKIGTPEDVANAVLFLAGDTSSFITGQVLGVNGGLII